MIYIYSLASDYLNVAMYLRYSINMKIRLSLLFSDQRGAGYDHFSMTFLDAWQNTCNGVMVLAQSIIPIVNKKADDESSGGKSCDDWLCQKM